MVKLFLTVGITIYIRYRQILQLYEHHPDIGSQTLKYNKIAVWFGLASCLGISFVANFQETNVRIVHFVGAFCCFGFGTVYFWFQVRLIVYICNKCILTNCFQALLSYNTYPMAGSKIKARLRLAMAICCTVLFLLLSVSGIMSHILFQGQDPRKW